MPVHDWTRVDAGLFHAFHQRWISALSDALNDGLLPPDYFALAEQTIRGPIPDVLALRLSAGNGPIARDDSPPPASLAVATVPPRARVVQRREQEVYAAKADRIAVRHRHGRVVAVIEIISPGNKGSVSALRMFVEKAADLIEQGVHLLVIDLFPPTKRDPRGIHQAIWDQIEGGDVDLPADRPLTLAAYDAGPPGTAYVEPIAVGDRLIEMPLFLRPEHYVAAPLEATYDVAWRAFPGALKGLLDGDPARPV